MRRWLLLLSAVVVLAAVAAIAWWPRAADTLVDIAPTRLDATPCGSVSSSSRGARTMRLVVYRGRGVTEAQAGEQLGRLAAFYAPYGIRIQRSGPVRELDVDHVMAGDREAIDRALAQEGIEPSRPADDPKRARLVVCELALAPLRRLLSEHRRDGGDAHVWLLRELAPKGSTVAQLLPDLRGLTVSPTVGDAELRSCLAAGDDFPPTVLLGLDAIARRVANTVDVTLAHEVGHVLGLEHSLEPHDLMAVQPPTCLPVLGEDQLTKLTAH